MSSPRGFILDAGIQQGPNKEKPRNDFLLCQSRVSSPGRSIAMLMFSAMVTIGTPAAAEPITSPAFPGKCVEAFNQGQSLAKGALLRLADCNGSAEQDFRFDAGTSRLVMHRLQPPLCVDLFGAPQNGAGVLVNPCNDNPGQKWGFPFDSLLRSTVDPNKCVTHATRAGKPATGWTSDSEVDPGCEFGETGGGFCSPTFAALLRDDDFDVWPSQCAAVESAAGRHALST